MTNTRTLANLAIRTESQVETLSGQRQNLIDVLELVAIAGSILDQVKRKIYYGEKGAFKAEKLNELAYRLASIESDRFEISDMEAFNAEEATPVNTRVVHGIVGMITETAELAEALQKYLRDGAFDAVNLFEELADVRWYEQIIQDDLKIADNSLFEFLIAKLSARYGDKFSDQAAVLRDIGNERDVMERLLKAQAEVQ